ncbi:glycine cleavage system aminomethyltransferase GcvT [Rubrobacter indicoceani]|uniref:glycine cleavage system aminomethyltransferase GcvT n=1 Tax=Rubrobacter indicoceani TaxID=2051957 RepID=UPI000E5C0417|nr:glycine cleavage system aminomethyltransferase GcvT [Rubrobacter indicoceani]
MAENGLKRTPLHREHVEAGAKLVDFAGYEMPVQYTGENGGIKAEHGAVRNHAGLFDVSHMGEVFFRGADAEVAVQRLVTRDVSRLEVGQAGYAAVCHESGGTVDDVLVYKRESDYLVVVNAANREKDLAHFRLNTADLDVEIADESEGWALLALQGPEAVGMLQRFTGADLASIKYYRFVEGEVDGKPAILSRTGYTGEDGFEVYLKPDDAPGLWKTLTDAGAVPAGLGARDTLRLEAGMCLYGNDLSDDVSPLEAGIGFAVHLIKEPGFIGQAALLGQDLDGAQRKLVALEVEGRGIARHGYTVTDGAEIVGEVTSGTQSPTLGKAIALALVDSHAGDDLQVIVRERPVPVKIVGLPFYKRESQGTT